MSLLTTPYQAPEGAGKNAKAGSATMAALAGAGILLLLPGLARADRDGFSYGHAEITLGFPNGQVTVGKTWDDDPRPVVVVREEEEPDRVIVEEHRCPPPAEKVTIIERYPEPVREVHVVREVYVERPACERPEVVVYRRPAERVICAPSRTVIYATGGYGEYRGYHEGGWERRGDHGSFRDHGRQGNHGGYSDHGDRGRHGGNSDRGDHGNQGGSRDDHRGYGGNSGPRDLFPDDHGRPARARGVQNFAQR